MLIKTILNCVRRQQPAKTQCSACDVTSSSSLHQVAATSSCLSRLDKYWLENERLDAQISAQPRNMQSFYCLVQERGYLIGVCSVARIK